MSTRPIILDPTERDTDYRPLAIALTDEQITQRLAEVRRALAGDFSNYGMADAAMRELIAGMERLSSDLFYAHLYDRKD